MEPQTFEAWQDLPEHLAERTRRVNHRSPGSQGKFVLYWLHHGMRAHENPALDVATILSNRLRIPMLVYQSLPEAYPYASDRHHSFILEGARDLQREFSQQGIDYAFHLEGRGHPGGHLRQLSESAGVVVTEEMPVEPFRTWTEQLASTINTPTLCVDTACVVSMQLVGRAYERAFQFREATQSLYDERVSLPWPELPASQRRCKFDLPFQPLALSEGKLPSFLAECDIDHSVAPVPHTPGGSTAGYSRWESFKQVGLGDYSRLRNDPLANRTSRLSAYLHYGMVSPMRIAREAAEHQTAGADKYLDELLIWRELAHAFCFFRRDHETLAAVPDWARDTLAKAESDTRPAIYSWETLARGRTGDKFWDAAQRSLLMQGELHNNVRMTWGKALLNWTPDAGSALAMMIDLNHRYALDGRDPASYGGILWCFGQFDRPFKPAAPIFGTVRQRSTREHTERIDVDRYQLQTSRPLYKSAPSVAVIGAGLSGLMCARSLLDHGVAVSVFEKSRGVGGRMATRRTPEGLSFDHGAQYFTVRDDRFARYVKSWVTDGIVAPWEARIVTLTNGQMEPKQRTTPRFVPTPGMNSICKHLATDLDIRFQTQVSPPIIEQAGWQLNDQRGLPLGEFDYVVTTAPSAQSACLLECAPALKAEAQSLQMNGCWAGMLAFNSPLGVSFDGAFVHSSPLSWIARNDSKPNRGDAAECWVLHASAEWTAENLEAEVDEVLPKLIDAFGEATGIDPILPDYATGHRWRFSIPADPLDRRCLFDHELQIGACGDWCGGPRVEGAFLSGMAMAGRLLAHAAESRS
jgi:photolyase PhrII